MKNYKQYDKEMDLLDEALADGDIDIKEYNQEIRGLDEDIDYGQERHFEDGW